MVFQIGMDFSAGSDFGEAKLVMIHYPQLRQDSRKKTNRYNLATLTAMLARRERVLAKKMELGDDSTNSPEEDNVPMSPGSRQQRAANKKVKQANEERELAGKIVQLEAELEGVFDAHRKEENFDFDERFGAGNAELRVHEVSKHICYVHSATWVTNVSMCFNAVVCQADAHGACEEAVGECR